MQNAVTQDAPIISKLIEEGVRDGSIQTTEPILCAEIFLLLLNYWSSPVLFKRNLEETKKRLSYLQSLMCLLGLGIIDNEFIAYVAQVEQEVQFMNYSNIFLFTGAISALLFGILSATMYARLIVDEYSGKRLALLFSYPVGRKKYL